MKSCSRITVLSSWSISCLVKCPKLFYVSSKRQASIIHGQRQIHIGCCSVQHKLTHVAQPQRRIYAGPLLSVREFHTSQPQFAGPLAVLLVKLAGPFSNGIKLAAVVGGRSLRKTWRKLSQHQRLHWSRRLAVLLGGFGGICVGFYFFHLEETPVTNRVRFMPISHKQMQELAEREHRNLLGGLAHHILPAHHPDHLRVFVVAKRLVMANQSKEMENLSWHVNVVDKEEMNAFVLPNGQIFIFTGMLKVLPNADSLAVVLGHEMSHVVLQHAAEKVSLHGFINMLLVISCALVWAVLPSDLLAIGAQWLQNMILAILLHLPYSRKLEEEADEVGMNMAAKACFDVRESPKLWRQLALSKNNDDETESPTWLSTHPTHNDLADKLEGFLPKIITLVDLSTGLLALKIRENCKCSPISPEDLSK